MANKGRTPPASGANRRFTRSGGRTADWSQVDSELVLSAIAAASMAGGALRFGYTSDGGAYAVGIYGDGDKPYTEYLRPDDDVDAFMRDLEAAFLDIHAETTSGAKKTP